MERQPRRSRDASSSKIATASKRSKMTAYRGLPAPKLQRHDDRRENRKKRGTNHNIVQWRGTEDERDVPRFIEHGRQCQYKLEASSGSCDLSSMKKRCLILSCELSEISYGHTNTMHQRESETRVFAVSMKILRLLDTCSMTCDMNT